MNSLASLERALTRCPSSISLDCEAALPLHQFLSGMRGPDRDLPSFPWCLGYAVKTFGFAADHTEPAVKFLVESFGQTGDHAPLRAAFMLLCLDRLGLAESPGPTVGGHSDGHDLV